VLLPVALGKLIQIFNPGMSFDTNGLAGMRALGATRGCHGKDSHKQESAEEHHMGVIQRSEQ
jgi:hypothetical protein